MRIDAHFDVLYLVLYSKTEPVSIVPLFLLLCAPAPSLSEQALLLLILLPSDNIIPLSFLNRVGIPSPFHNKAEGVYRAFGYS